MAAPKGGLLAILTKGKPAAEGGEEATAPESSAEPTGSVGERAAQDAIDAINGGDAAGLYDAMARIVAACSGESEME